MENNRLPYERYYFADGLRGFFSVVVLLYHAFYVYYLKWLPSKSHFGVFLNGDLAVNVFFLISGFSLTVRYLDLVGKDREAAELHIKKMAIARYFRLALPCFFASLIMYLIYRLNLNFYARLDDDMKMSWWAYAYKAQAVSFWGLIKFSFYDVFFPQPFIPIETFKGVYYLTNLWTMSVEFLGSILCFVYVFCTGQFRKRVIVSAVITLAFVAFDSRFCFFMAGILLADIFLYLRHRSVPAKIEYGILAILLLLSLYGCPWKSTAAQLLYAFLFVFLVSAGTKARALFSSAPFRYIGKSSFSLYLVHMAVIVSLQSYVYTVLIGNHSINTTIAVTGIMSVAVSLALSHLFTYVDHASISFSHKVAKVTLSKTYGDRLPSAETKPPLQPGSLPNDVSGTKAA